MVSPLSEQQRKSEKLKQQILFLLPPSPTTMHLEITCNSQILKHISYVQTMPDNICKIMKTKANLIRKHYLKNVANIRVIFRSDHTLSTKCCKN